MPAMKDEARAKMQSSPSSPQEPPHDAKKCGRIHKIMSQKWAETGPRGPKGHTPKPEWMPMEVATWVKTCFAEHYGDKADAVSEQVHNVIDVKNCSATSLHVYFDGL